MCDSLGEISRLCVLEVHVVCPRLVSFTYTNYLRLVSDRVKVRAQDLCSFSNKLVFKEGVIFGFGKHGCVRNQRDSELFLEKTCELRDGFQHWQFSNLLINS